jgi:hypothetical protein
MMNSRVCHRSSATTFFINGRMYKGNMPFRSDGADYPIAGAKAQ